MYHLLSASPYINFSSHTLLGVLSKDCVNVAWISAAVTIVNVFRGHSDAGKVFEFLMTLLSVP